VADFLLIFSLPKREIFLVESRDQAVHGIGYGDGDQDEIHVHFHGFGVGLEGRIDTVFRSRLRGLDAGADVNIIDGVLRNGGRDQSRGKGETQGEEKDHGAA
jgi:hypothetical protein